MRVSEGFSLKVDNDRGSLALAFLGIISVIFALVFYIFCLNHISVQSAGITYNSWTGEVGVQTHPGWYVTNPAVRVAVIDTLPIQVCLFAGNRITTCKLVRFNASEEGVKSFVAQQGFSYYNSGSNINCNIPQSNCGGVAGILKGYAFSGEKFPFLEIVRDESVVK